MGYKNGRDVLPPELLEHVRQYAEGECIYIPRKVFTLNTNRVLTDKKLR